MRNFLAVVLAFAVTAATEPETIDSTCPFGLRSTVDTYYLQPYDGSCFYFVLHNKKQYSDANRHCIKHGGTLALPKTEALNRFIEDKLLNFYGKSSDVWIGLHDKRKEGMQMQSINLFDYTNSNF
ncbi:hypothetical protein EGW08_011963, partial [Elysia chlorotica]